MSIEAVRLAAARVSDAAALERPLAAGEALSPAGASAPSGPSFADALQGALHTAAAAGTEASTKAQALARGAIDDVHGTMISAKEAEISLKLVGTVRNKLLDAFQELWRTHV